MVSSNPVQSTVPPSEDSGRELCLFSEPWEICLPSEFEPYYTVTIARSEADLKTTYAMRYEMYCKKLRSLPFEDYPDDLEIDAFDPSAVNFVSKIDGEVVGCTRLVFPMNGKFLMETGPEAFTLPDWVSRSVTCESSRLIGKRACFTDGKKIRQSHFLLKSACLWSLANGYRYWLVAAQYDFYKVQVAKGWPFIVLGPPKQYHNGIYIPVMHGLKELMNRVFSVDP